MEDTSYGKHAIRTSSSQQPFQGRCVSAGAIIGHSAGRLRIVPDTGQSEAI